MNSRQVAGQETLNYRLRPNKEGVCLEIWENDPDAPPGDTAFRFFVTYELKSTDDAQAILNRYLISNRIAQAVPSHNADHMPLHLRTLADSPS